MIRSARRQNYRSAFWRTAGRELAYRRFLDINTLIGLRVENERVLTTGSIALIWLNNRNPLRWQKNLRRRKVPGGAAGLQNWQARFNT